MPRARHRQGRYDLVREGVVVLMGTLAAHLDQGDTEVRSAAAHGILLLLARAPPARIWQLQRSRQAAVLPRCADPCLCPSPAHAQRASIVETLLEVLSTPSEAVQRAVSSRLAPLMPGECATAAIVTKHAARSLLHAHVQPDGLLPQCPAKAPGFIAHCPLAPVHPAPSGMADDRANVEGIIQRLLAALKSSGSYGARRGAAFGLAGVVKGLGIASLKGCVLAGAHSGLQGRTGPCRHTRGTEHCG